MRQHPAALCWRQGLSGWQPARAMPEFAEAFESGLPQDMPPIPLPEQLARMQSDDIDYRIVGNDMPFVEVELDPGESAVAEAGAMMYKDAAIEMGTVFGDGSRQEGGLMNKLLSAGRRIVTGESLFTTVFTHQGRGKARVAFAAPYPGTVLPLRLAEHGGCIICQKDSFLAGARGVRLGVFLQKRILTGLFGGEGFIMQKIEGDGWVFVHAGGTLVERDLAAGERIDVDTGCVVAFHPRREHGCARRRRHQEHAVRWRRHVSGNTDRPRQSLAAIAALLAHGGPHAGRRPADGRQGRGRRLRARRPRPPTG